MRPIPLNFLTLYADLLQNVAVPSARPGSVSIRKIKGADYLYVTEKDGGVRKQYSLGRADDPEAREKAAARRHAAERAKSSRKTVTVLKQSGMPAPALPLGRVLEAVANAGLFRQGVILVGTAAYQVYACVVGFYLSASALMTNDADLLVASLLAKDEPQDIDAILKRADPSFRPLMAVGDPAPKVFQAANNFQVDILTKYGRGRKTPVPVPALGCAAEALSFMEYLAEESMETVALYGAGVLVRVPPPMRFAIHKLLVAPERSASFAAKKAKDLAQAAELLDIFLETDEAGLQDALDDARDRGPKWKKNITASLRELGRDVRQGFPPVRTGGDAKAARATI